MSRLKSFETVDDAESLLALFTLDPRRAVPTIDRLLRKGDAGVLEQAISECPEHLRDDLQDRIMTVACERQEHGVRTVLFALAVAAPLAAFVGAKPGAVERHLRGKGLVGEKCRLTFAKGWLPVGRAIEMGPVEVRGLADALAADRNHPLLVKPTRKMVAEAESDGTLEMMFVVGLARGPMGPDDGDVANDDPAYFLWHTEPGDEALMAGLELIAEDLDEENGEAFMPGLFHTSVQQAFADAQLRDVRFFVTEHKTRWDGQAPTLRLTFAADSLTLEVLTAAGGPLGRIILEPDAIAFDVGALLQMLKEEGLEVSVGEAHVAAPTSIN